MQMLRTFITEQFNGVIWRMEIDGAGETIFIETRNEQDKQVSFSSIGLQNGSVYFKQLVTAERWLAGMETAYDGVLLLHNYQSEKGPLHKGLQAVDAYTGHILWSNYIYAFDHLTDHGPVVYDTHIHPKKLYLADIKTGATTRLYEPFVYAELKNNIVAPQQIQPGEMKLPLPVYANSVHYLEYNNFRIVSLHSIQGGALQQYLFVMDGINMLYEDLLNTGIQKLQPEAFIMHKNHLIYIKNRSELRVINL